MKIVKKNTYSEGGSIKGDFEPVRFYSKDGKTAVANNQQQYDHYTKTMGWSTTPPSSKAKKLPASRKSELTASQAAKTLPSKKSDAGKNDGKPKFKNLITLK